MSKITIKTVIIQTCDIGYGIEKQTNVIKEVSEYVETWYVTQVVLKIYGKKITWQKTIWKKIVKSLPHIIYKMAKDKNVVSNV